MRCWIVGLALLGVVYGCGDRNKQPPAGGVVIQSPKGRYHYREISDVQVLRPGDDLRVTVDVVQVHAPAGAISGQEDFWQIVDAGAFGEDLQSRLSINGVRAGIMSAQSWDSVREIMERAPDVISHTATLAGKSRVSLDARAEKEQTIFYYDRDRLLQGRTYEDSQNLWGVHFAPDPARLGNISMEVSPVVQSRRRLMRVNRAGNDYQLEYDQPEAVLDLSIATSLPIGSVLVLAPTRPAFESSSSIGRAFLTEDASTGLVEHIIFLYPHLYRLEHRTSGRK